MNYDYVIFGVTSAALGIANELKQKYKILIINKTSMVAYEFINAYKLGTNWEDAPESELGKAIEKELVNEKIITDKNVYIYSAGAMFYKAFKALDVDILLETQIAGIQKTEDNYELSIYNVSGYSTIKTKYMIDTTEKEVPIKRNSLNCLLINKKNEQFPSIALNGVDFFIEQGDTLKTVIMKYACPIDASIYTIRHKLIELWQQRPKAVSDWMIATIGLCFDSTPEVGFKQVGKDYIALSSSYYDNPLAAIDAGVKLGRRILYDI